MKLVVLGSRPRQNVKLSTRFHVVVEQRRQKNVQKSVMHVQSWFFACLNLLLLPLSLPSSSALRKLPIISSTRAPENSKY